MTPPIDDPETLRRILANTDALLLDFDGPICSVFAGIPAPVVADQLRGILAEGGHTNLPADIQSAADPFEVLFYAAKLGQDEARYVEAAFRAHEVEAVQCARPTPSSSDVIRAWTATGRPLAVVSNNSTVAVELYLELHNLESKVDVISARISAEIAHLKPSPFLLIHATKTLGLSPSHCALVGDSITDIQASIAAQSTGIGYANKPEKIDMLVKARAKAVSTSMTIVLQAIRMI
jgi:HAD superfamily hydrolase (TIGR01549 family)